MRLEEPELLVSLAAHLGEEIGRVGVSKAGGFVDRLAHRGAEGGDRARERLEMLRSRGNGEGVRRQRGSRSDRLQRALGGTTERGDALRNQIHELPHLVGDLVEKLVERDEIRTLHVPMRLLGLQREVDREREMAAEQRDRFCAYGLRKRVLGLMHRDSSSFLGLIETQAAARTSAASSPSSVE